MKVYMVILNNHHNRHLQNFVGVTHLRWIKKNKYGTFLALLFLLLVLSSTFKKEKGCRK